jgi:hypothetical protein
MSDDLMKEIAELKAKLAELESRLPKEEKEFVPSKPWQPIDYTAGMTPTGDGMKPVVDLINSANAPKFDPNAWSRNRYSEPGGFGPPKGNWPKPGPTREEGKLEPEPQPWTGWNK